MRMRPMMLATLAGSALAYLYRKNGASAPAKGQHAMNRATGLVRGLRPDHLPENDQTLIDKVRSEVLGRDEWHDSTINVSAADGAVMLHGQLDHPEQINRLEAQVAKVTGVRQVDSALHLPGTLPPNKREAMTARPT